MLTDRYVSEASQQYKDELRGLLESLLAPPQSYEVIRSLFDTICRLCEVAALLTALEGRQGPEMRALMDAMREFVKSCDGLPFIVTWTKLDTGVLSSQGTALGSLLEASSRVGTTS